VTKIHGSPFNGAALTRDILHNEGLTPHYKITIETGDEIYFSLPYSIEEDRMAVMTFVLNRDAERVARTYYLSHSQAVWRYLPQYVAANGKIIWYSKGHSEDSIMAPLRMQILLAGISAQKMPRISTFGVDPNLIFAGTTWEVGKQGTYILEVDRIPESLPPNFYATTGKVPPQNLEFQYPQHRVNFTREVAPPWSQDTAQFGTLTMNAYASYDQERTFVFCREAAPRRGNIIRAGVGGLENNSPITSTGLRKRWIRGSDLVTGIREYFIPEEGVDQTGGYGDPDWQEGPYVDMFQNYNRQIPMVRGYLATVLP
jgi:hypothetical protein